MLKLFNNKLSLALLMLFGVSAATEMTTTSLEAAKKKQKKKKGKRVAKKGKKGKRVAKKGRKGKRNAKRGNKRRGGKKGKAKRNVNQGALPVAAPVLTTPQKPKTADAEVQTSNGVDAQNSALGINNNKAAEEKIKKLEERLELTPGVEDRQRILKQINILREKNGIQKPLAIENGLLAIENGPAISKQDVSKVENKVKISANSTKNDLENAGFL